MESKYEEILEKTKKVVIEAGKLITDAFESREIIDTSLEIKDNNSADLVTAVDKNIEKMLHDRLKELFPEFLFVGEETTALTQDKKCGLTDAASWVIDPLDGTTNFVHAFPFVCISVALVINKDPVIGIIYNPIMNNLYWGIKGKGSFMDGKKLPLIKNNPLKSLQQSYIITEYGAFREMDAIENKLACLKNVLSCFKVHGVRSFGSCAMNMCFIARGSSDLYYEIGVHAWDVAAGTVILREAGGAVINWVRPKDLDDKVLIVDEPYNILGRHILCIRNVKEGKEHQSELIGELRSKLIDFHAESD